jgi:hypothetical protein
MVAASLPFPYAHDQSVTQRITVACRCSGLRCNGSLGRSNSDRQFGAVRKTNRPLRSRASVFSPVALSPWAMSFKQVGPAMMTICWPISIPAVENCKISERLFSFRITSLHGSPCPRRPPILPKSGFICPNFDQLNHPCQQNSTLRHHNARDIFFRFFPASLAFCPALWLRFRRLKFLTRGLRWNFRARMRRVCQIGGALGECSASRLRCLKGGICRAE